MAGGFLRLAGAAQLAAVMQDAIDKAANPGEYWVGSAVPYGPFHEFGTSKLASRPHWVVALRLIALKYELATPTAQNEFVNAMLEAPQGLVRIIALDIERQVKILITGLGIIDTGNYRGSIATGPTESEAFDASASVVDEL